MNDYCKEYKLTVTIQENGLIRDPFGWVVGRCDEKWLKLMTKHEVEPPDVFINGRTGEHGIIFKGVKYYCKPDDSQELHTI